MKNFSFQRNFNPIQQVYRLKHLITDQHHSSAMYVLIAIFIIWVGFSVLKPLNVNEHQDLVKFSEQTSYPLTRQMALDLLIHDNINRYQYFRVIRAAHVEQKRIYRQEDIRVEIQKPADAVY